MDIKFKKAHKSNVSRKRLEIEYIIIHEAYSSAEERANYFATKSLGTSVHYVLDDKNIFQCVDDSYKLYHMYGSKYYHTECRNSNSIAIEYCIQEEKVPIDNLLELTKELMQRYNIPANNVLRHYDITHRNCPHYFIENEEEWEKFKDSLNEETKEKKPE